MALPSLLKTLIAASAFGCSLITRIGQFSSSGMPEVIALGLSVLGLGLMVIGGWFGGEMVFRQGIGSPRGDDAK